MVALLLVLAVQDADVLPLKDGTTWTYRTAAGQAIEVRILGASTVRTQVCRVQETSVGPQITQEHLAVTPEGLTAFKVENAFGTLEYPTPILRAKLPFKAGDAWTVRLEESGRVNEYQYRTDGPEKVVVPAGTFEAWKVTATLPGGDKPATVATWYAKGVGMVRQVHEIKGPPLSVELASSSLLAPPAPPPRLRQVRRRRQGRRQVLPRVRRPPSRGAPKATLSAYPSHERDRAGALPSPPGLADPP